jgi:hypothetical protein
VVEAEASLKAALGRRGYTGAQAEINFLAHIEAAFAEAEYEIWLNRLWSPLWGRAFFLLSFFM